MLALGVLVLCCLPLAAQENNTYIQHAMRFAVSPPLSELAKLPQSPQWGFHEAEPVRRIPKRPIGPAVDTVEQRGAAPAANYSIIANILGVGNGFPGFTIQVAPPDTTMAVGDNQIVQWVNEAYTVCQKTSPYTCGPAILGNNIWTSLGGPCAAHNDGDIIAQWDVVAHRWVLAQNDFNAENGYVPPYHVCLAISTSNDANGTYFLYQFPVVNNGLPDYPKWGIWTANYGQTWDNFGNNDGFVGPVFCAYNRTKLLAGDRTAEQICHQYSVSEDNLLPADRDGIVNPPSGEDQFAIGSVGDVDNSHLSEYSVHINNPSDWTQGATFTGDNNSQLLSIASFTPACNGAYNGNCVPQKGVPDMLESLGGRLMYRLAYTNDGPPPNVPPCVTCAPPRHQHWVVTWDVTASGGNNSPRWLDIIAPTTSVPVTSLSVLQQATYAPDGNWRWFGSVARDKVGDILLGYSLSCGSTCPGGTNGGVYPSVYITGRQPSDPSGTMEAETQVVGGTGSQTGTGDRWGDYSTMRLDTNDGMNGCTFWYTTEYYMVTASFDWSTRINSAQFSNCH
jgi:hypothetical protein